MAGQRQAGSGFDMRGMIAALVKKGVGDLEKRSSPSSRGSSSAFFGRRWAPGRSAPVRAPGPGRAEEASEAQLLGRDEGQDGRLPESALGQGQSRGREEGRERREVARGRHGVPPYGALS